MKKLYFLIACLCVAWAAQAQNLKKEVVKDGVVYTDGKKEALVREEFHYARIAQENPEEFANKAQEISDAMGNRIIPMRVKELLKEELKKESSERGYFLVNWVYNDRGEAVGADIVISNDLADKITEEEVNEIYRRLMKEKIDLEGRIQVGHDLVEPSEKPRLSSWLLMYVAEDFMLKLPSTVHLD